MGTTSSHHAPSHEVNEGWCKGNVYGSFGEGTRDRARPEAEGLRGGDQQCRCHCHAGGEEDWCVHCARPVPFEDSFQASYEGRRQDDVRQGDKGECKASQDNCESLSCGCTQEADLKQCWVAMFLFPFQMSAHRGNPMERSWKVFCGP